MKWFWYLRHIMGHIWFRATVFCIVSVATALAALYLKRYIPEDFSRSIGADAVDHLLNIIAAAMLAVTIFSMNIMVSASSSVMTIVTPRSAALLSEDKTAQNVLSTFIGAFIFSLVGIIALRMEVYSESGRFILFVVTICVLFLIILTLIRWIEYLSDLGTVSGTISMVEKAARLATLDRIEKPYLGGERFDGGRNSLPPEAQDIFFERIGHVQFIDMQSLAIIAKEGSGKIYVHALPGYFVSQDRPVVSVVGINLEKWRDKIKRAFVIDNVRSFDQDPRFGMIVLAEIASQALSPARNDAGTAIDIVASSLRVLSLWCSPEARQHKEAKYQNVFVPPLFYKDIFDDTFRPIARDGAMIREIGICLQKALITLHTIGDNEIKEAAANISYIALEHARAALVLEEDVRDIERLSAALTGRG